MDDQHEKRAFQRIQFEVPVSLCQGERCWESEVVDISLKGILIRDEANMQLDTAKPVEINLALSEDAGIHMTALWSHSHNGSHGFRWTHVDIESMIHLRRLLELNSGDPDLLERELGKLTS